MFPKDDVIEHSPVPILSSPPYGINYCVVAYLLFSFGRVVFLSCHCCEMEKVVVLIDLTMQEGVLVCGGACECVLMC
jgi:hypothetical protein